MIYDERMIAPMRAELTRLGVEELRTADAVDAAIKDVSGTQLVVVNSVCGCAARNLRPADRAFGRLSFIRENGSLPNQASGKRLSWWGDCRTAPRAT